MIHPDIFSPEFDILCPASSPTLGIFRWDFFLPGEVGVWKLHILYSLNMFSYVCWPVDVPGLWTISLIPLPIFLCGFFLNGSQGFLLYFEHYSNAANKLYNYLVTLWLAFKFAYSLLCLPDILHFNEIKFIFFMAYTFCVFKNLLHMII